MGLADVRAGTQKYYDLLSTRPNISESHSEISTRVPLCIAQAPTCMCLVWNMAGVVAMKYDSMAAVLVVSTVLVPLHCVPSLCTGVYARSG